MSVTTDRKGLVFVARGKTMDSEQSLLFELSRLHSVLGRVPKCDDMRDRGKYSAQTYFRRFGSWNDALRECGFEPNVEHGDSYAEEDLLDVLKKLGDELGRAPRFREISEQTNYSGKIYTERFGSLHNALDLVGFEWGQRSDATPGGDLIAELNRLHEELGKIPSGKDMKNHGRFSITPYYNKWGDWESALKAAGFDETPTHPGSKPGPENPNWKGGVKPYYGADWMAQRRAARSRDGLTCQGCRMTEEEHLEQYGVKLHVHHIVPFQDCESPEKANRLSNLVTLCYKCHRLYEGTQLRPQLIHADD